MRKIPTIFKRDPDNMSRVTDEVTPDCLWVFNGEGTPTVKIDGTAVKFDRGVLYKRREVKQGQAHPVGFSAEDYDPNTEKWFGWVPVGDGPEDKYLRDAAANAPIRNDGTYEFVGPKVQGNPYGLAEHRFIAHGNERIDSAILTHVTHDSIARFFKDNYMEGIVWHHPDGRMAKIKRRDFGLPWPVK